MAIGKRIDATTGEITEFEFEQVQAPMPTLNNWRFKAMVAYLGLDETIRAGLAAIPDPLQRAIATSRYENSAVYHRNDPMLLQMQAALGLDDATVDSAWLQIAE